MTAVLVFSCANAYCITVSKHRIEISVAPSESYRDTFMVRNAKGAAVDVGLRVEGWHKAVEGIAKAKDDTFSWIEINPREFELKKDEEREVAFKVTMPETAQGELNAMIFVKGAPKEVSEGAVGINMSIGIPIYVMAKGTEIFEAEVEELKITRYAPLEMAITIRNSGNVHIRPKGVIDIRDDEQSLFSVPLNEYNYPVLPHSSRTLEIKTKRDLSRAKYEADIRMGYADKKHRRRIILTTN